jgi:hypothetical protein
MLATKPTFKQRIKICGACDRLFRPTWTCKECGCFMGFKARLAGQSCPLGKWQPEDEA